MKIRTLNFVGDGSSLWGISKGTYRVNTMEVDYINWVSYPKDDAPFFASMTLTGPNTRWFQYTDAVIINQIRQKKSLQRLIRTELQCRLDEKGITKPLPETLKISWSEQGMQPDNGWNFDISGI